MFKKLEFNLKNRVLGIVGIHIVALIHGIFSAIFELIAEERPVTEQDIFYITIHILFHTFLISTMALGVLKGNKFLLLPWLIVTIPVFASLTYFVLKYSNFGYFSQLIVNISFICFIWYLWFTVYQFFRKHNKYQQWQNLEKNYEKT